MFWRNRWRYSIQNYYSPDEHDIWFHERIENYEEHEEESLEAHHEID